MIDKLPSRFPALWMGADPSFDKLSMSEVMSDEFTCFGQRGASARR